MEAVERVRGALKDSRALLNIVGPDTTPGQIGKVDVSVELGLAALTEIENELRRLREERERA